MKNLSRRKFILSTSMGVVGASAISASASKSNESFRIAPKINSYRTFGRTGFKVSDICCGFSREEAILKAMLDNGMNLIETSEIYNGGNHERSVGKILKEYDRSKIFVATKIHKSRGELDSKAEVIERFNNSLKRLDLEYIDGYMIHAAQSSDAVLNKHFHSAMKQLKKEGKVRYLGVSCHGSSYFDNPDESMEEVLGTAIDDGRFDFVELVYNFFEPEMGARILNKCSEKNIGTMIMKSSPVYLFEAYQNMLNQAIAEGKEPADRTKRYVQKYSTQAAKAKEFFSQYGISGQKEIRKAALQFILSNDAVSTIPAGVQLINDLDFHLEVSGTKLEGKTSAMLDDFSNSTSFMNCRIGCDKCESSCPHLMPVNTILRYNYYFIAKRDEKYAMSLYNELPGNNMDACKTCEGHCEKSCPYGVMTRGLLTMAHENLSMTGPYHS